MRRELDPTRCQATVYDSRGFYGHQCQKKPVVTRDGKLYCRIHDPEYIAGKRQKEEVKYDKEWAEKKKLWALDEAREKALMGLTLEELRQVTPEMIRTLLNNGRKRKRVAPVEFTARTDAEEDDDSRDDLEAE